MDTHVLLWLTEHDPNLGLAARRAIDAVALPGFVHADPADRFLIATARRIGATLMTRDVRIAEYARGGNLVVAEA